MPKDKRAVIAHLLLLADRHQNNKATRRNATPPLPSDDTAVIQNHQLCAMGHMWIQEGAGRSRDRRGAEETPGRASAPPGSFLNRVGFRSWGSAEQNRAGLSGNR